MEEKDNADQLKEGSRAYNILLQRHINDDRLMGERNSIFLASSSILFLGFTMIAQTAHMLSIIIPILGFAFCSAARTSKGLDFWEEQEKRLENENCSFAYMKAEGMLPHLVYDHVAGAKMGRLKTGRLLKAMRNRIIYLLFARDLFHPMGGLARLGTLSELVQGNSEICLSGLVG